ncbi:MAG: polysaccharide biosynthesis protein [Bacteroidetes bacterium]|nr:polysaccharide biosynthesis protein [Bacteroidota bacterium]
MKAKKPVRITPAKIVLAGDVLLIALGFLSAILLNYRILSIEEIPTVTMLIRMSIHLVAAFALWYLFKIQKRVIRHFHVRDYLQIIFVLGWIHVVSSLFNFVLEKKHHFSAAVWLLSYFITVFYVLTSRILVSYLFEYYKKNRQKNQDKRLIIFGAAELGLTLKKSITSHPESGFRIMGFIDDDINKVGKIIEGFEVYSATENLRKTIVRLGVTDIIIATKTLDPVRKSQFLNDTIIFNIRIRELPSLEQWFDSHFNLNTIKQVNIHDLLNREPINLHNEDVMRQLAHKVILVTGAAGSIGSEIVRRLVDQEAEKIICVDIAETPLYELEQELKRAGQASRMVQVLADVRNEIAMQAVFDQYHPHFVFHAAAYKHVPIIEAFPHEALQSNVMGTWITSNLAGKHGVEKFVLVSTDKAINPTSIMGASKRMAEMVSQSLQDLYPSTDFIVTRFGNVLGSNGSVVPLFQNQIQNGGPVTITHPEMQRYFMTIPEAAQLVVEAGLMGQGGEVFIFDMGEPVKIYDLAMNMIRLAGLVPGVDIPITFTGIRPGEKLYEDLFADQEQVKQTHHKKIMIGKVKKYSLEEMQTLISELNAFDRIPDKETVKQIIRRVVPEYKPMEVS